MTPPAEPVRKQPPPATRLRAKARALSEAPRPILNNLARYSRFVSLMKVVLPLIALLLVGLVIAWPYMQPIDNRFTIGFSAIKAREAAVPSMVNARYTGTDDNSRPYSVTADLARNLYQGSKAVELEMPKADITLSDGTWLAGGGETGVYSVPEKTLKLSGGVYLYHDSGYEIKTSKATLNLANGTAEGNQPVEGQGPFGTLKAEGFRLHEKDRVITFTGKAKLVLYPPRRAPE